MKIKSYRRRDGKVVKGYERAKNGWAVYPEGRRTAVIAPANLNKKQATAWALRKKTRGGDKVDTIRRLTDSEERLAAKGKWIRTGRNGEKPGYEGIRGYGPPTGGYNKDKSRKNYDYN